MTLSRRRLLSLAAALPVALPAAGLLATPALAREPETFQVEGLAIRGIDPVAYFTDARPVPGQAMFALRYRGAEWRFANAENRARFEADPDTYGAQFGGYCAFAAARGYLAPTIPEAWAIHENRLYLNATLRVHRRWLRDVPGNIAKAQANWPGILG